MILIHILILLEIIIGLLLVFWLQSKAAQCKKLEKELLVWSDETCAKLTKLRELLKKFNCECEEKLNFNHEKFGRILMKLALKGAIGRLFVFRFGRNLFMNAVGAGFLASLAASFLIKPKNLIQ